MVPSYLSRRRTARLCPAKNVLNVRFILYPAVTVKMDIPPFYACNDAYKSIGSLLKQSLIPFPSYWFHFYEEFSDSA